MPLPQLPNDPNRGICSADGAPTAVVGRCMAAMRMYQQQECICVCMEELRACPYMCIKIRTSPILKVAGFGSMDTLSGRLQPAGRASGGVGNTGAAMTSRGLGASSTRVVGQAAENSAMRPSTWQKQNARIALEHMQGRYERAIASGLYALGASSTLVAGQAAADSAMRAQHPPDKLDNYMSSFRDGFERGAAGSAMQLGREVPDSAS